MRFNLIVNANAKRARNERQYFKNLSYMFVIVFIFAFLLVDIL
jgi:hypothetical protein